jgi:hypothetical protein
MRKKKKQEIKHKDICPDLNIHLPSHKYDLRVSVSIEEVVLGAAQIDFSDVMFDRKRDRFSQVCVLPPQHANIPMPDAGKPCRFPSASVGGWRPTPTAIRTLPSPSPRWVRAHLTRIATSGTLRPRTRSANNLSSAASGPSRVLSSYST